MSATSATFAVLVNDQRRELAAGATLMELLRELGLSERKGVAAAVNGEVVGRRAWENRALADGDSVLVIRATQGG